MKHETHQMNAGTAHRRWIFVIFISTICLLSACEMSQSRFFTRASTISVNELGYLNKARKIAVYAHPNSSRLQWELIDSKTKQRVTQGKTIAFGQDPGSQQHIHQIDFSDVEKSGQYFIQIGSVTSRRFDIREDLYETLHVDAFRYFYFHRLGSDIEEQYLHHKEHAHSAIHAEQDLPCHRDWCGKNVRSNVKGAWADAGDFGVYPVNHAFAVWTLVNAFELSPSQNINDALHLPESGNNIPDLLDELRYGANYLSGMLTSGDSLASHKITNEHWSPFEFTIANENKQARFLQPPSTAATLALARMHAQLARVFLDYDKAYAQEQWKRAKDALQRASMHATVLYESDTNDSAGGGDYADNNIQDDWYAALSESLITAHEMQDTTTQVRLRERVRINPFFLSFDSNGSQSWQSVEGAASLSLWLHWDKTGLNYLEKDILKQNILESAEQLIADQENSGYLTPYNPAKPSEHHPFPVWQWGSNSIVANNMLVLAYAYHITLDHRYLFSFLNAFDYLLGRNAMSKSFITGYGTHAESDTHDRLAWKAYKEQGIAYPPGWLSGGPMNDLKSCRNEKATPINQPAALAYAAKDTAPFAWCSKENAINWNASLYWIAKYATHASDALH